MNLSAAARGFLVERHLVALSTVRPDGSVHVVAVGCTVDEPAGLVRVITSDTSVKVRLAQGILDKQGTVRAAVCQIDGRRWLTLEGTVRIDRTPAAVADAEDRYAQRYRTPRINPRRVVYVIAVDRVVDHC